MTIVSSVVNEFIDPQWRNLFFIRVIDVRNNREINNPLELNSFIYISSSLCQVCIQVELLKKKERITTRIKDT